MRAHDFIQQSHLFSFGYSSVSGFPLAVKYKGRGVGTKGIEVIGFLFCSKQFRMWSEGRRR